MYYEKKIIRLLKKRKKSFIHLGKFDRINYDKLWAMCTSEDNKFLYSLKRKLMQRRLFFLLHTVTTLLDKYCYFC